MAGLACSRISRRFPMALSAEAVNALSIPRNENARLAGTATGLTLEALKKLKLMRKLKTASPSREIQWKCFIE